MTAAPSMAEVLAEHAAVWASDVSHYMPVVCGCGAEWPDGDGSDELWHDAHVAQALAGAGFGHVASVERERDRFQLWWEQGERLRAEVERVLDGVLGTEEDDGAGEGLVADVRLATDRLTARAEAAEARLAAVRRDLETLRDEWWSEPTQSALLHTQAAMRIVHVLDAMTTLDGEATP